jgi:hypothetical protein
VTRPRPSLSKIVLNIGWILVMLPSLKIQS